MTSNKQRRIERVYPLSPMQSGMLFHALQNEHSRAYFEQMTFRLKGDINKDLLQQSFDIILARYDILRTIFRADKLEEPLQFVLKERNFRLHFEDISHLSETEKNTYLQEFVEKDKEKGFDLTRDILMRVTLFKMGADAYALVWSFHHILMDGWCLGIIYNELNRIYRSKKTGRPIELEPVTPYVNYINWLEQQDKEKGLEYWENYLEGYEQQAGLPKLKPADQLYQLEEYDMVIDEKEARALNTIARKNQVTVNTVFQTLWGILLQRYTNSNDVVFGAVVSGRPPEIKGIEIMVGLFLNTIPTRIKSREEDNVVQLLAKVQEETARSKNYEYLLLADIQSKTALKGSLIDHIMAFENLPVQQEIKAASGEKGPKPDILFGIQDIKQYNQTNYDFNIIIIPQVPFVVTFNYNSRIYEKEFVHRVGLHLKEIIKQVLDNPDTAVKEIEIITEEERQQVLFDFNQTEADYPKGKTIHALFEEQAKRTPNHIAIVGAPLWAGCAAPHAVPLNGGVHLTYRELNQKSNLLAHVLREKGAGPDIIVGIMVERSPEMVIGILGILKSGGAYLPIDPDYPRERIDYMLQDSAAKELVITSPLAREVEKLRSWEVEKVFLDEVLETPGSSSQPLNLSTSQLLSSSNLAYVIYTSGTTGKPKGVMIEHGNVVRLMVNNRFQFDFNDCDVWTLFHSFCFDFSVWEMYGALLYGGKLIIIPKMAARDTGRYLEILKKQQVTVLNQTPSAFYALVNLELKNSGKDLNLRYVIFGGEALSPGKLKEWKAKYPGTTLINMYGITETTVHVTFKEIENSEIESDVSNIGEPIPTLSIYVLDKHLNLQPIGTAGELCVGGDGVGRGYLNRPELTAEKFIFASYKSYRSYRSYSLYFSKRIYKSGDLARWLPEGELEYLGRIDHQVKIRGFRIEPGEIESRLSAYKGIEAAVVLSRGDEKGDKYLCAYFVAGDEISISGLREYLSGYLPEYMVPSYFIRLGKIPLTSNGKLDRKALPEPGFKAGEDYTAPRNELEETLVEIWSEVLGIEKEAIGIDHNFFELGGHSLKATILISRIHKVLDVKIPLAELFIKPSIRELSRYIKGGEKETYVSIDAVEDKEYYPVSSAQKRLYLLNTMDPESTAYNSFAVFTPEGGLGKSIIEETSRKLIHRHESLRTSFHLADGEPVQRVHDEVEFEIEYYDLAAKNAKEREEESLIRNFIRPFDFSKAPLLRIGLIKTSGDGNILMVDMHHIVTDGTSMGLLMEDFMALYRGEELPGLRLQYKDYSQWQNSLLGSEVIKRQESYWLNRFAGEIPVLNLPTDYPRPANLSFEGDTLAFILGKNETGQLKALALEEEASLFMVLLAVFNVFLAKVSGQERIVVGTPTAGRRHTDLEKIIGMFVNTLPLSNEPNGEKTFREFLKELKKRTLEAFENQDFQFEDLVDKVVKERDTSHNPLFDVMFALQNMEASNIETKTDVRLKPYPFERAASLFDLTLQGTEAGENILFTIEYRTKLFKKETAARLIKYYNQVVASILANREKKIAELEIITDEERRQVLFDFNETTSDYPQDKTIHELFEEQAARNPGHTAVNGVGASPRGRPDRDTAVHHLTYYELNRKSNQLAHMLREKGVCPNTIVGIMVKRSLEMIIGIFAILKAGGAYLPITPDSPKDRILFMLKDSAAMILLSGVSELSEVNGGTEVIDLPSLIKENEDTGPTHLTYFTHPAHLSYVIYTSGSTGKPKGVLIEHGGLVNTIHWRKQAFNLTADDNVLQLYSFTFDGFVASFFTAIISGTRVTLMRDEESGDVNAIKEAIISRRVTHTDCVPSLYASLLEMCSPGELKSLQVVTLGGEELKPSVVAKSKLLCPGLRLMNEYGPTEITIVCTMYRDVQPGPMISIGKPKANMQICIWDRYDQPVPIGIAGELCVSGVGVARGYLNRPELTAERFSNYRSYRSYRSYSLNFSKKIYKTGDLSRWLPDGNLQFLGRIDHQAKIRGFRIEPGEIENQLLKHEKIREAAVVDRQDENNDTYLCAYYVSAAPGDEGKGLTVSELREFLSGKLPMYMIPSYFIKLPKFPVTSSGKLDRKSLPAPDISNIELDSIYAEPEDDLERLIADTWQEVLKLDRVGTRDNFFDLGGNSLKILRVSKKLSEVLGVKIAVVNLFQYPTISSLKGYLNRLLTGVNVQFPGVGGEDQKSRSGKEIPVNTDIAIIGMAGRFPGAGNIRRFWENLKNSIESISFFSAEELKESGVSSQLLENPDFVKARAMVEDKDQFDAAFFNYTPREARVMDPQMRVFHECVWEALEDAGYNPETYDKPIGLYAGASKNTVWELRVNVLDRAGMMDIFESHQLTDSHFIPTRISYRLNLKGPAMFIHTACSTSLTATHTACNALLVGDCTMALAGGVNLLPEKASGYLYQEGLVMSPDGHCRAFDGGANGTVGGEGAAVVLLKPLEQALKDRDHIYALIKAAAANNDGARKVGFSAPSIAGQAEAIAGVYRKAGIPPESITYIETHGTGTVLGDPIELEALKQAFNTQKRGFCALGSVKTNVGHTDTAAGVIGLIKTVLALSHKQIPPSLHFEVPNFQVDLADSPFYVSAELSEWEPGTYPRRAGVSSFGIGGTNAHVVLEEWPEFRRSDGHTVDRPDLILLSAKTPTALDKIRENLANYLKENLFNPTNPVNPGLTLADVAYTLQVGRKTFNHRWMTVCSNVDEAIKALTSPGGGEMHVCVPEEGNDIPLRVEPVVDKPALTRIGQLWLHGQEIDWRDFYPGEKPNRVSLPAYPFERQRYWIEGNLLKIENLQPVSREVKPTKNKDIADWFYFPRWLSSMLVPSRENTGEALCFIMFINECPLVKQLAARLRLRGTGEDHRVITVEQGDTFKRKGDDEFVIDPHSSDDYHRLFTGLNQMGRFPNRVVHCWNVTDNGSGYQPGIGAAGPGFYSLLYLSRSIGNQDFGGEIRIDVVTTNVQEVTGNETLIPGKAVVLGPLKVIPQEYPYIICRSIDIEVPVKGSPQEDMLAGCLIDEFLLDLDSPDTDIAYRAHYRWIKTYEPVRLEAREPESLILEDRGVYLITGGTGNIGFTLAEYLVKHFRARLVLTGVSPLPAREEWDRWLSENARDSQDRISGKIKKIRRLEAAGGEVLVLAADAADKQAMKNVIRTAEQTFGPINGVIHAAGVTNARSTLCPIEEIGEEELNQQFHPKIKGTLILADLFKNKKLDFCLLTASLSPILGGLGFFAYSAANAFMDAFAHLVNRGGPVRWISVDWADWGFGRDVDTNSSSSLGASALEMMITPDEGVETFKRILTLVQTPTRQVVVSSGDLQARIDQWVKLKPLRKDDSQETVEESLYQFQERPNLSSPYTAPLTPMEKDIADIWKHQFGYEKIGVNDDFFELGGDSLKAISMISRIHKELNARVQLNEFFTRPTIETLSQYITAAEKGGYVSIPPVEKREYYELSSAQKRLFVLDRMETLGTSYNLSMVNVLHGELDKESLEETFNVLLERHESFRTSFEMLEGEPVQKVYDKVEFEIEYFDLAAKNAKEREEKNLIHDFIRPFDLSLAPLLRVGLMRLEEERNILMVDMHHIIFDGVSQQVLFNEFASLYGNKDKTLPPLRLQYKDYSGWQNSPRQRESIAEQEAYWLKELGGEIPVLALPIDYPRPLVQSFAGGAVHSEFTIEETGALNEIARSAGATLFMVLLAVYDIFISKISSQEDIQVGTPIAGRPHADLEQIVGMFVNTLVMRNHPSPLKTFRQFLEQVKEKTLQAFENQDCQFEDLVEKLEIPRDTSRNPLFDVVFVLQNIAQPTPETPVPEPKNNRDSGMNLKVAPLPLERTTSQFDLVLEAGEQAEQLYFQLQYCSKLLQKETIERFIRYFKKVAAAVIANPEIRIAKIEIVSEEEKTRLLEDFNADVGEYPEDKTIHDLFEEQASRTPDGAALVGAAPRGRPVPVTQHLTYKELNQKSNQLANVLRGKGVGPDTIVGIMLERSIELIIGILGILKAGGAYLAIDPNYPRDRIDYMLQDSNAALLLTERELSDAFKGTTYRPPVILPAACNLHLSLAYIIYTSGTSGRPKGILVGHGSLVNLCYWHNRYHGVTGSDHATQYAGIGFDASVLEIFPHLIKGAALHIISDEIKLDIDLLARYYRKNNISISFLPTQFCQHFMTEKSDIPSLRVLLTGGDKLNRFVQRSYRLCDNYGPAENTVVTTIFTVESHHDNIPIGKPIANVQVHILNRNTLQLQPLGVPGELCITGDGLARGYVNNPELTAERFINKKFLRGVQGGGFYKTGDLARWLPDGNIQFLGRIDLQVQIRGFRVEPAEIQGRLCSHQEVKDAIVVANDYSAGDKYLCAYIVPKYTGLGAESALKQYLSKTLPDYMIPSYFIYLDEIPLTPNGKVDRRALSEPQTGISKNKALHIAPRNAIEGKLAEVWSEILGFSQAPGIDDDFFELGGHSLKATILVSKVQKAFNVHLPLTEVFRTPTVRELALYINNAVKEKFISIEPAEERDYYPLSSAQKRLYILQQMEAGSTVYNMPQVIPLDAGAFIDKEKLTRTFERLIARHESLRTSFITVDEEPVQVIHDEAGFEIEYLLAAKSAKEREEKNLIQDFVQPFDLSKAPLLRVGLIHNVLIVDMHHIISDGMSMQLSVKDFISLYSGEELPPLRIQYKDYAFWQQREMRQETVKQQEAYWLKEFAGDIPFLDLPLDFPRPPVQRFEGSRIHSLLSESEVRRLKEVASALDATLYMVLLGTVNLLLHKLTGNEDIILGSAVAGRRHADLEPVIGMFVNTLALRNHPTSQKVVKSFLREVKEKTLQAFENQDYQFEELVEKVSVERDVGRNPIFDVMFTLQNMVEQPGALQQDASQSSGDRETVGDLDLNPISKFDLTIMAYEGLEGVRIEFEYSTALFKQQTIQRFSRYFRKLISEMVENPDISAADIEIIPEEEKQAILFGFNRTHRDYPGDRTIHELYEEQVERSPDDVALVGAAPRGRPDPVTQHLTYKELNQKSNQLAHVLREKGVGPDVIVGIMLERSIEMIIAVLGILKAGGAYLPIDPDYPRERIDYMLQDSAAKALVITSTLAGEVEKLRSWEVEKVSLEEVFEAPVSSSQPLNLSTSQLLSSSNLAYVIYTSGTSGRPKGTMIDHASLVNQCTWHSRYYEIAKSDHATQYAGIGFDASVFEIFPCLTKGAALHIISDAVKLDLLALKEYYNRHDITVTFLPTQFCQQFMEEETGTPSLQRVITGGEKLSRFVKRNYRLYNNYGPTENTVVAAAFPVERAYTNIPIGKPIQNNRIYILGKNSFRLQPIGVPGELCITGNSLSRGYLNQPELTAKKFLSISYKSNRSYRTYSSKKIYKTGDLARWLPDGNIEFLGRIDQQVKLRGFRIELAEIENQLLEHPWVKEAVVLLKERAGQFLCAYITTKDVSENENVSSELNEYLSRKLPDYMIPSYFVSIGEIPLTPSGKIDRKALPEPAVKDVCKYASPRDKIEEKLAAIWSEVLNLDVGIDDNFFDLGGHSLKATIMTSKIHKKLNVKLPLAEVFQRQTIRKLSEYIRNASAGSYSAIEKAEEKEYYPLSAAQKRLYIIQQMELPGTRYNMLHMFPFAKEIDEKRLEETFIKLIKRHESLRTGFHMIDDEPVQKVHEEVEFEIEYYDLAAKNTKVREEKNLIQNFIRPFDLSKAPLMRVGLIKTRQTDYLLVIEMHHIISDGTSQKILEQEFSALYAGKELSLLKLQYKDYSQRQNSSQQQEIMETQEKYWLKEFSGELSILNLPADHPRPPVQRYEGRQLCFFIDKEITNSLKECCRKTGASLYMVLLSAFNVLLSRLSGQEDIIVGTPMAGRRHADLQDIIGMFVNTLSMRNYPERDKKFSDFLKDVKERTLEVYENQEYPFEELVDNVSVQRDTSRNPIFDVLFNFLNQFDFKGEIKEAGIDDISDMGESKANFDIIFQGSEVDGFLYFTVDYCTTLYQADTIKRFITYFKRILIEIKEDPTQRLSSLDLISEDEKKQVLVDFNDTAKEYPRDKTIIELFAEQVAETPGGVAVAGVERRAESGEQLQITYYQLNEKSDQLAYVLRERGVGVDTIVGIMMERSIEMIIGILGILKSGGAYLPIDPDYPEERTNYVLNDSGARVLLSGVSELSEVSGGTEVIDLPSLIVEIEDAEPTHLTHPTHPCYIIYTSGTTGKPKGVLVEHSGVFNTIYWRKQEYNLTPDDSVLQLFSFSFDGFVTSFFTPIVSGSRVVLPTDEEARDIFRIKELIASHKITHFICVPSLYVSLLELCSNLPGVLSGLRIVTLAGENVQSAVVEKSKQLLPHLEVVNEYGATENTVAATVARDVKPGAVISIGKPLSNTQVFILDRADRLVPIGIPGQLCIAGIGIARGYMNRPELTAEKFINFHHSSFIIHHLYRTGDLARWLADGNIEFIGRMDLQVKIRGFRIELGEIENQLLRHEYVKETVVIDREDESGDKYLSAYIVIDPGFPGVVEGELREYLSRFLPGYMIPSAFVQMEKIPLTSTGKIHRKALPEPEIRGTGEYEAPRSQVEEQLVCIYRELLEVEKVGVRDDFFALGGNSLNAIKLISQIHETFDIDISVVQIFKTPRIRDLASVFMENRFLENKEEIVTLLNSAKPKTIFAFPPAVGYSIAYTELARLLENYGFYAFNYIEKQGENQMKIYLDAIREIQPEGPYILLGYSSGGRLCVKAAELLEKAGHIVSDIIILDTYTCVPQQTEQEKEEETDEFYQGIEKGIEYLGLQHMKQKIMDTVKKYIRYHDNLELCGKVNSLIHLIQAEDKKGKEGFAGWGDFTRNREIVYEGHGVHREMLAPDFIERNVEVIEKILIDSAHKSG